MCNWGAYKEVLVKIPSDLSSTGSDKWKVAKIDSCIADIVNALQTSGIDMRGSCCGHSNTHGHIHFQDGRILIILQGRDAEEYYVKPMKIYARMLLKRSLWICKYYFWKITGYSLGEVYGE
jgi:hypothetical protein